MSEPEHILAGLDADQRRAATALKGPVVILAGAGTGKTRAITHRIAYGVATGVYNPHQTLALTFTTRAASEMRSRLRDLGADGVQARTFHSAALRQLTYFWPEAVGGPMHTVVSKKTRLLIEGAQRLRMHTDKATLRDLAGEIEWAKVSMLTPETYPEHGAGREFPEGWDIRSFTRFFQAYEDIKTDQQLIDLDDVLLLMVGILESEPHISARIRQQYRTFIVDEYQDVSPLQQRLLQGWLGGREDLCVVGDASQTIYSFTGATSDYLLDFPKIYPHAQQIKLVRDYRSTPEIVELANQVLEERTHAVPRPGTSLPRWPDPLELVSQRAAGPAPVFSECPDEAAEADWVAENIKKLVNAGRKLQDIAVLYRTNSQSLAYEQALRKLNLNFQLRGAEGFFSRDEVRHALLQLRASSRSSHDIFGAEVLDRVKAVLSSLGYSAQPPQASGAVREKWESLDALVNLTADLVESRGERLTLTALVAELDERAENHNAPTVAGVTLASLHSAKGLEWDVVFLAGMHEGLMPISFAETQQEVDEERRLFYVGITRARDQLFVSWSLARSEGGRPTRKRSRFLENLVPEHMGHTNRGSRRAKPRGGANSVQGQVKGAKVPTCRQCANPLVTAAERKIGRCSDCPAHYSEALFEELKTWRTTTAQQVKMPAFVIFTDATLLAIAEQVPTTDQQLRRIRGVGEVKLSRYGQDLLDIILRHSGETKSIAE